MTLSTFHSGFFSLIFETFIEKLTLTHLHGSVFYQISITCDMPLVLFDIFSKHLTVNLWAYIL